jgi:dihydroorotase
MSRKHVTQPYDLVIKNGLLVDPAQGIHAQKDVAFYQGRVVAVDDELGAEPRKDARQVIDATGKVVTPGLIDLHVHVRGGRGVLTMDPVALLCSGSTTVLDAGTYGAANFAQFRGLASTGRARVYAFLSISAIGIPGRPGLEILDYANVEQAVETCQRNRDLIKGVKVLLTRNFLGSNNPLEALSRTKEAAEKAGLPMHVHGIRTDQKELLKGIQFRDVIEELRPGDIHTHTYARYSGIVDEDGRVVPEAKDAVERGVILDVGHGSGSFHWQVAEKSLRAGVGPQTISTDLHTASYMGPTYDMATTMSKYMRIGCSIDQVVEMATIAPAKAIDMADTLGSLKVGAAADATIMDLVKGEVTLHDGFGNAGNADQLLTPRLVVSRGVVYLAGSWRQANWVWPPRWRQVPPLPD